MEQTEQEMRGYDVEEGGAIGHNFGLPLSELRGVGGAVAGTRGFREVELSDFCSVKGTKALQP